jgi:hypothetical protein
MKNKNFVKLKYGRYQVPSFADPGCLSLIPDPDFCTSRILDPKTATKETEEKKFVVLPFFVATNITKLNFFYL